MALDVHSTKGRDTTLRFGQIFLFYSPNQILFSDAILDDIQSQNCMLYLQHGKTWKKQENGCFGISVKEKVKVLPSLVLPKRVKSETFLYS